MWGTKDAGFSMNMKNKTTPYQDLVTTVEDSSRSLDSHPVTVWSHSTETQTITRSRQMCRSVSLMVSPLRLLTPGSAVLMTSGGQIISRMNSVAWAVAPTQINNN